MERLTTNTRKNKSKTLAHSWHKNIDVFVAQNINAFVAKKHSCIRGKFLGNY